MFDHALRRALSDISKLPFAEETHRAIREVAHSGAEQVSLGEHPAPKSEGKKESNAKK